ncbi:MAG: HPr family phosphocarrier protein [Lachnospiraceae bacterium]|nr:HPr family phosphocarrier protein [Lachnospiraceae bacterium]
MVSRKVTVINPEGLHLKPAANFCKEAVRFKSLITFTFGITTANAKSVLSVLGACVKCGDEIEIVCDGEDEVEALSAMCGAVESGLGEKISDEIQEQE